MLTRMENNKRRRIGGDNAYATFSDTVAPSNSMKVFGGQRGFNAHMETVRLWAEPRVGRKTTTGTADSTSRHRSVAEVRRAQYFHNVQSELEVEAQILRVLLAYFRDDIKLSFRIHRHFWTLDLLIERLMKLDAWPSQYDLQCIASYCKILFAWKATKIPYDLNRVHRQTYFVWVISEVEAIARWLSAGKESGENYERWHNKVLLVCLCFLLNETETSSPWDHVNLLSEVTTKLECAAIGANQSSIDHPSLFDTFPTEVVRRVSLFFDFTSLRCFSSASRKCRAVCKSVPENKAKWRRNLYFARNDAPLPTYCWNWKSLCLTDVPLSQDVANMSQTIFYSSDECVIQQGGFVEISHEGETSKSLFDKVTVNIERFRLDHGWTPCLFHYRQTHAWPHPSERMAFWGRNPFKKSDLLIPFEGYVISPDRCIFVFVGWDESGGFIGTGVGKCHACSSFVGTGGFGRVSDITLCARYLPKSDIRLTWSTEHLLSVLRRQYDMKILPENEYPWKSSVFDLDFSIPISVNFLDKSLMTLNVRPGESIHSIKTRILSSLRVKESESATALAFRLFHGEQTLDETNVSVSEYNADENSKEKVEPGALLRLEPPVLSDLSLEDVATIKPLPEVFSCSPLPHFCPRLEVHFNFIRGVWGSTRIFRDIRDSPCLSDLVIKRQCLWCRAFVEKNIVLPEEAILSEGYRKFVGRLKDEEDFLFCGDFCFFRWLMFQGRLALTGQNYELIEVVSKENWSNQCFQCGGFHHKESSLDNSFELIAHFEDEGQEDLFYGRCCSRKCSILSLQEITRFAKEEWPSYSFTKGMRRIECSPPIDAYEDDHIEGVQIMSSFGWTPCRCEDGSFQWIIEDPTGTEI